MKKRRGRKSYAEIRVKRARLLLRPRTATLKCWLEQEAELRWWNWNRRPEKYRPEENLT